MTTLSQLQEWKDDGAITADQHRVLESLVRHKRFSIYVELNALLFVGVLSFIGGVGWLIQRYFAELGDLAVVSTLTLLFAGSLYYCFTHSSSYSAEFRESPDWIMDYVLYLGCLAFGLELTYIATQFEVPYQQWDMYLAISAAVFFVLAYRFDNRFVLSLALSTLAGWFGISLSRLVSSSIDAMRSYGLVYGVIVAVAGALLYFRGIKRHFTETYCHIAATVLFVALLSGVIDEGVGYLFPLLLLGFVSVAAGIRFRRFSFVLYGIGYSYAGLTAELLGYFRTPQLTFAYFFISGTIMVLGLAALARRVGREE